jgi:hypothetical protein
MSAPVGFFDPTALADGWFDEAAADFGIFAPELVTEPAAAAGAIEGQLAATLEDVTLEGIGRLAIKGRLGGAGEVQFVGAPVVITWAPGANPAAQTVSVPAGATAALLSWSYWNSGSVFGLASASFGGAAPDEAFERANAPGIGATSGFVLWRGITGGADADVDVEFDAGADWGPCSTLVFLRNVDAAGFIDAAGAHTPATDPVSINLATAPGDLVVVMDSRYGEDIAEVPPTEAGYTSLTTQYNPTQVARVRYLTATTTEVTAATQDPEASAVVGVVLRAAAAPGATLEDVTLESVGRLAIKGRLGGAGAPALIGTPVEIVWETSATPAAQDVTVPAGANALAILWTFYNRDNDGAALASTTLDGSPPDQIYQLPVDLFDFPSTGIAVWYNPPTESPLPLQVAFDFFPDEGPTTAAVFLENVDAAGWRDVDAAHDNANTPVTITLDTAAGDLLLVLDQRYNGPAPSLEAGYTSALEVANRLEVGRVRWLIADGSSESATTQEPNYSTIVGAAFRPRPAGAVLEDVTLDALGTLADAGGSGELAVTLEGVTLDAVGRLALRGTLAATLEDVTLETAGTLFGGPPLFGQLAVTLEGVTLRARGRGPIVEQPDVPSGGRRRRRGGAPVVQGRWDPVDSPARRGRLVARLEDAKVRARVRVNIAGRVDATLGECRLDSRGTVDWRGVIADDDRLFFGSVA